MKLTTTDKSYILAHQHKSPEQLSLELGKPVELIHEYMFGGELPAPPMAATTSTALKTTREWKMLRSEYEADELAYIESKFHQYMSQFNNDMAPTEQKQLLQMIETDVMMHRNKRSRKAIMDTINSFNGFINAEMAKPEISRDIKSVLQWQSQVDMYTQNSGGSYREFCELQKKHDDLMKALDSTRQQRANQISSKVSWDTTLKEWADKSKRAEQAKMVALMRMGASVEEERLTDYHTYEDGAIDQPILTSETLKDDHHPKDY